MLQNKAIKVICIILFVKLDLDMLPSVFSSLKL